MSDALDRQMESAWARVAAMTPEQREEMYRKQRESWVKAGEDERPVEENENKNSKGNGNDGGGFDGGSLHPFIQGLLKTLPANEGDTWEIKDRVKWLKLAASAFDMIYEAGSESQIVITEKANQTDSQ